MDLALAMFRRSANDEVDTLFLMTRGTGRTPAVREVVGLGKKGVILRLLRLGMVFEGPTMLLTLVMRYVFWSTLSCF